MALPGGLPGYAERSTDDRPTSTLCSQSVDFGGDSRRGPVSGDGKLTQHGARIVAARENGSGRGASLPGRGLCPAGSRVALPSGSCPGGGSASSTQRILRSSPSRGMCAQAASKISRRQRALSSSARRVMASSFLRGYLGQALDAWLAAHAGAPDWSGLFTRQGISAGACCASATTCDRARRREEVPPIRTPAD